MTYEIINRVPGETGAYAEAELARVLRKMDGTLCPGPGGLSFTLTADTDSPLDDRAVVRVENGRGEIHGSNPRACLIAVYRFFIRLGCVWTFPGESGEHIPQKTLTPDTLNVVFDETASYRYRGVVIEGALSEENAIEMLEFLPRVGMNAYYVQFRNPSIFFRRWYEHWYNRYLPREECPRERAMEILTHMVKEIDRRGLIYQTVGHGWTSESFGVENVGWEPVSVTGYPNADFMDAVAEVNGKRDVFHDCILTTELCFSRADVRTRIADNFVEYCREHPRDTMINFCLADGRNNHCECAACREKTPTDWYVMILNEIDDKLTAAGLPHMVSFESYNELAWAPVTERLHDSPRFVLEIAPWRSYSKPFLSGIDPKKEFSLPPFVLNRIKPMEKNEDILGQIQNWRKQYQGDAFTFEYHLMYDPGWDPGSIMQARVIHQDMKDLVRWGVNGNFSCQLSRVGYPTGIGQFMMARTLWDRNVSADDVFREYFTAEFGDKGEEVFAYLRELTERFCPPYLRRETPAVDPERAAAYRALPAFIAAFRDAHPEMRKDSENMAWRVLAVHADGAILLAMMLAERAEGRDCHDLGGALAAYLTCNEEAIQPRIDIWNYFEHTVPKLVGDTKNDPAFAAMGV